MTALRRTLPKVMLLLAVVLVAGGCGKRERAASGPAATPAPAAAPAAAPPSSQPAAAPAPEAAVGDNNLQPVKGETRFTSQEGGFSALFPDGCARVRTRISPKGADPQDRKVVQCWCDLAGRPNSGVMVTVHLAVRTPDGGPPVPGNVSAIISDMMQKSGVQLVQQGTLRSKERPGVRVFARQVNGTGAMWFQGMLIDERIYVLHAWRPDDRGLSDEEATRFFNSFELE